MSTYGGITEIRKNYVLAQAGKPVQLSIAATDGSFLAALIAEITVVFQVLIRYRFFCVQGDHYELWKWDPEGNTLVELLSEGDLDGSEEVKFGRWVSSLVVRGKQYRVLGQKEGLHTFLRRVQAAGERPLHSSPRTASSVSVNSVVPASTKSRLETRRVLSWIVVIALAVVTIAYLLIKILELRI